MRGRRNSVQPVNHLSRHGGKRVARVGSDHVGPSESRRIFADLVRQAGGQVVDEMHVAHVDKGKILRRIRAAWPGAICSTVVGDGIAHSCEACRDAGFDSQIDPIASQSTQDVNP